MSTVPTTNVAMTNIVSIFAPGKPTPHAMNQFYLNGSYVTGGDFPNGPVPTSGAISFGQFRGASAASVYNLTGTVEWGAQIGWTSYTENTPRLKAYSVCGLNDGGIIVISAGEAENVWNADGTVHSWWFYNGILIVKYNASGGVQWKTHISNGYIIDWDDLLTTNCVAPTTDGGFVISGKISENGNTVTANNANGTTGITLTVPEDYGYHGYLCKYDASGTAQWIAGRTWVEHAGVTCLTNGDIALYIRGVPYWKYSQAYNNNGAAVFNANGTVALSLFYMPNTESAMWSSIDGTFWNFVVKYNSSGTVQWRAAISNDDSNMDNTHTVPISNTSDGGCVVLSYVNGTSMRVWNSDETSGGTFNPGTTHKLAICKFNASGIAQYLTAITETPGSNMNPAIVVAPHVTLYFTQSAYGTYGTTGDHFVYQIYNICPSSSGAVFVIGNVQTNFNGSGSPGNVLNFYNSSSSTNVAMQLVALPNSVPNFVDASGFVCKYNASGTVQWVAYMGTTDREWVKSICETDDGGCVIVGNFYGGSFETYNANGTSFGTTISGFAGSGLVCKYNTSGSVQWIARVTNSAERWYYSNRSPYIRRVCKLASGKIAIVLNAGGYFGGITTTTAYSANNSSSQTEVTGEYSEHASTLVFTYG